jgi:Ca2+-binding RTX toxin-like protein
MTIDYIHVYSNDVTTVYGTSGSDLLAGSAGANTLIGRTGNDSYVVDNVGDRVIENPGEGTDTAIVFVNNYNLAANVENANAGLTTAQTLYGSSDNNQLLGNSGDDYLTGQAGNDTIFGAGGNDILKGGAGSDTLAGDPGADTFMFDLTALTPAQPGSAVFDRILDYDQGNTGTFNLVPLHSDFDRLNPGSK